MKLNVLDCTLRDGFILIILRKLKFTRYPSKVIKILTKKSFLFMYG